MTIVSKKQLIAISLVVMLVSAGYVNYKYKEKDTFANEIAGIDSQFESERIGEATLVDNLNQAEIGEATPTSATPISAGNIEKVNNTTEEADFFEESRLERELVRDQETEVFEKIIASSSATAENKNIAQKQLNSLVNKWEKEMICERLIKAKGFTDVVVLINEGRVSVVVSAKEGLKSAGVAQIQDIITREMGVPAKDIRIVEKNK